MLGSPRRVVPRPSLEPRAAGFRADPDLGSCYGVVTKVVPCRHDVDDTAARCPSGTDPGQSMARDHARRSRGCRGRITDDVAPARGQQGDGLQQLRELLIADHQAAALRALTAEGPASARMELALRGVCDVDERYLALIDCCLKISERSSTRRATVRC